MKFLTILLVACTTTVSTAPDALQPQDAEAATSIVETVSCVDANGNLVEQDSFVLESYKTTREILTLSPVCVGGGLILVVHPGSGQP